MKGLKNNKDGTVEKMQNFIKKNYETPVQFEVNDDHKPAWRIIFAKENSGPKKWFWFAEAINANFTVPEREAGKERTVIQSETLYFTKALARSAFKRNKHKYPEIVNFVIHY